MKLVLPMISTILLSLTVSAVQYTKFIPPENPRVEKKINTSRVFIYFPEKDHPPFERYGFDDSRWPVIALKVTSSSVIMKSTPDHVIEFRVDVADRNGVHGTGASNTLKFRVERPATLVGPDVYVSDRDKKEAYEGSMYIDMPVTSLIRATGETGRVRFTASSPGLLPASCEIEVVPCVDPHPVKGISEPLLNPEGHLPVPGKVILLPDESYLLNAKPPERKL